MFLSSSFLFFSEILYLFLSTSSPFSLTPSSFSLSLSLSLLSLSLYVFLRKGEKRCVRKHRDRVGMGRVRVGNTRRRKSSSSKRRSTTTTRLSANTKPTITAKTAAAAAAEATEPIEPASNLTATAPQTQNCDRIAHNLSHTHLTRAPYDKESKQADGNGNMTATSESAVPSLCERLLNNAKVDAKAATSPTEHHDGSVKTRVRVPSLCRAPSRLCTRAMLSLSWQRVVQTFTRLRVQWLKASIAAGGLLHFLCRCPVVFAVRYDCTCCFNGAVARAHRTCHTHEGTTVSVRRQPSHETPLRRVFNAFWNKVYAQKAHLGSLRGDDGIRDRGALFSMDTAIDISICDEQKNTVKAEKSSTSNENDFTKRPLDFGADEKAMRLPTRKRAQGANASLSVKSENEASRDEAPRHEDAEKRLRSRSETTTGTNTVTDTEESKSVSISSRGRSWSRIAQGSGDMTMTTMSRSWTNSQMVKADEMLSSPSASIEAVPCQTRSSLLSDAISAGDCKPGFVGESQSKKIVTSAIDEKGDDGRFDWVAATTTTTTTTTTQHSPSTATISFSPSHVPARLRSRSQPHSALVCDLRRELVLARAALEGKDRALLRAKAELASVMAASSLTIEKGNTPLFVSAAAANAAADNDTAVTSTSIDIASSGDCDAIQNDPKESETKIASGKSRCSLAILSPSTSDTSTITIATTSSRLASQYPEAEQSSQASPAAFRSPLASSRSTLSRFFSPCSASSSSVQSAPSMLPQHLVSAEAREREHGKPQTKCVSFCTEMKTPVSGRVSSKGKSIRGAAAVSSLGEYDHVLLESEGTPGGRPPRSEDDNNDDVPAMAGNHTGHSRAIESFGELISRALSCGTENGRSTLASEDMEGWDALRKEGNVPSERNLEDPRRAPKTLSDSSIIDSTGVDSCEKGEARLHVCVSEGFPNRSKAALPSLDESDGTFSVPSLVDADSRNLINQLRSVTSLPSSSCEGRRGELQQLSCNSVSPFTYCSPLSSHDGLDNPVTTQRIGKSGKRGPPGIDIPSSSLSTPCGSSSSTVSSPLSLSLVEPNVVGSRTEIAGVSPSLSFPSVAPGSLSQFTPSAIDAGCATQQKTRDITSELARGPQREPTKQSLGACTRGYQSGFHHTRGAQSERRSRGDAEERRHKFLEEVESLLLSAGTLEKAVTLAVARMQMLPDPVGSSGGSNQHHSASQQQRRQWPWRHQQHERRRFADALPRIPNGEQMTTTPPVVRTSLHRQFQGAPPPHATYVDARQPVMSMLSPDHAAGALSGRRGLEQ